MYAIVKTGGKQYRVERGQTLLVERLPAEEGADIELEPLLFRSDETLFDSDGLKTVTVTARVLAHVRGEKLRVFKFKPKRGYKRRTGHRQDLTRIEVLEINAGADKPKAKAKATRAKAGEAPASSEATLAADASAGGETVPSAEKKPATKARAAGEKRPTAGEKKLSASAEKPAASEKEPAAPEKGSGAREKKPAARAKASDASESEQTGEEA
jgi:large subunit ribosomal protein L21